MATTLQQAQQQEDQNTFERARTEGALLPVIWTVVVFGLSVIVTFVGLYLMVARGFLMSGVVNPLGNVIGGLVLVALGAVNTNRYRKLMVGIFQYADFKSARLAMRADVVQALLIIVLLTVMFPVLWILSMSLDPRDFSRPQGLTIIPPAASLQAFSEVLTQPSPNDVTFLRLLINSLLVAGGTAVGAVVVGTSAAYAFSRMDFPGRRAGMLSFVIVLMIPPGATLAPLFVLLNIVGLRTSLVGLAIAYTSTALPFAIWNMKGFIDSLPYELEEAAQIDGCNRTEAFIRVVLPLAVPGMAVTAMMGFLTGWSEFILAWTFLSDPSTFTLPMVLRGMVGQYASGTPWSQFSAMALLMSIPPVVFFFFLQRYLIGGLAVGGVKG
ncbi:MAG: ABC transporter permease subunit [Chloroflexi bacterium]|nr:ABC transporter permease subunit [Chloroflexota bacterium]